VHVGLKAQLVRRRAIVRAPELSLPPQPPRTGAPVGRKFIRIPDEEPGKATAELFEPNVGTVNNDLTDTLLDIARLARGLAES